jgi:hypothetical protein
VTRNSIRAAKEGQEPAACEIPVLRPSFHWSQLFTLQLGAVIVNRRFYDQSRSAQSLEFDMSLHAGYR